MCNAWKIKFIPIPCYHILYSVLLISHDTDSVSVIVQTSFGEYFRTGPLPNQLFYDWQSVCEISDCMDWCLFWNTGADIYRPRTDDMDSCMDWFCPFSSGKETTAFPRFVAVCYNTDYVIIIVMKWYISDFVHSYINLSHTFHAESTCTHDSTQNDYVNINCQGKLENYQSFAKEIGYCNCSDDWNQFTSSVLNVITALIQMTFKMTWNQINLRLFNFIRIDFSVIEIEYFLDVFTQTVSWVITR